MRHQRNSSLQAQALFVWLVYLNSLILLFFLIFLYHNLYQPRLIKKFETFFAIYLKSQFRVWLALISLVFVLSSCVLMNKFFKQTKLSFLGYPKVGLFVGALTLILVYVIGVVVLGIYEKNILGSSPAFLVAFIWMFWHFPGNHRF